MKPQMEQGLNGEDVIQCPVCGFEYNHMGTHTLTPGNDNYEAPWDGRGDLFVMNFECEEGHDWQLCLGFHKGQVMIFARSEDESTEEG